MRKSYLLILVLFFTSAQLMAQQSVSFNNLSSVNNVDAGEVKWLQANSNSDQFNSLIAMLSKFPRLSAIQMLPASSFYDGSLNNGISKGTMDSLYLKPTSAAAGMVHAAYLIEKTRQSILKTKEGGLTDEFSGEQFKVSHFTVSQNGLNLSFDLSPAQTILRIVSSPNISYNDAYQSISSHNFDAQINHRNQSFYPFPYTREKMVYCLLKAASDEPLDILYRYMNPRGLFHYAEVRKDKEKYSNILQTLEANQVSILDEIKATILPLTPNGANVNRKVSLFFGRGADGWASGDVTGMDLEYYKDNYTNFIAVLKHETYHTVQQAVSLNKQVTVPQYQPLQDVLISIFLEGTATYVSNPNKKTEAEYRAAIAKGKQLFEEVIVALKNNDKDKINSNYVLGVRGAGPFYYLGADMTGIIVKAFGNDKIKEILPQGSVAFFKAFNDACKKDHISYFSADVVKVIEGLA